MGAIVGSFDTLVVGATVGLLVILPRVTVGNFVGFFDGVTVGSEDAPGASLGDRLGEMFAFTVGSFVGLFDGTAVGSKDELGAPLGG